MGRRDAAMASAAALVALLVGAAVGFGPVPTLIAVGAVLVLVMALAAPRLTAGFAILAILFVRPIEHIAGVDAVGYLDEGAVALCVVMLPLRRLAPRKPLRNFPG